jgi:hypothetical protein
VVVPFTDLAPETKAALAAERLRPRYVDVSADGWDYWRLVCELWSAGSMFALVEHDVVPPPGAVRAMLACPRDWCAHEYKQGSLVGTAFGCTKFSAAIIARHPDAVSRILPQHRGWDGLDSMVIGTLHRNGEVEHVHQPPAWHLHYPDGWTPAQPRARRRNAKMSHLSYVGTGRYLNGIPTADFDTDDPVTIAICLESGLYVLPTPPVIPTVTPVPVVVTSVPSVAEVTSPPILNATIAPPPNGTVSPDTVPTT